MPKRWSRLVRFTSTDGRTYQGDAIVSADEPDANNAREARIIHGNPFGHYSFGSVVPIVSLVCPLRYNQIGTVRLLGLNFNKHAQELGKPIPTYPIVITKPATAVSGPSSDIPVPDMAQVEGAIDYEVELVAVIGKPCRFVSPADALDYVAGFTVGNDMCQREWQNNRGGGQWNVSKMFDEWAPIGPAIVGLHALPNKSDLQLRCYVNDEERQNESSRDMAYSVGDAVSFLSQGSTLLPGDLLFMGTPKGVGMGFKPPKYLGNGDVVTCKIDGIGKIRNKIVFTNEAPQRFFKEFKPPRRRALFGLL